MAADRLVLGSDFLYIFVGGAAVADALSRPGHAADLRSDGSGVGHGGMVLPAMPCLFAGLDLLFAEISGIFLRFIKAFDKNFEKITEKCKKILCNPKKMG